MPDKLKVLVCVLTSTERQGWLCPEIGQNLFAMAKDTRFQVELATIKDAIPHDFARNSALALARDHAFDWCVQIDNDNFLPAGTPLDVIASAGPEQPVVGLTAGIRVNSAECALYPREGLGQRSGPFTECEYVGGALLMIHKTVWQKIPRGPWFLWQRGDNELADANCDDGVSEDVYFSRLVRQHGMRVWTHNVLAGHYKTCDATAFAFREQQRAQQAHAVPRVSPQANKWVTQ
jgi:hypothetical protein